MKRKRIIVAARCFRARRGVDLAEAQRDAPRVGVVRVFSGEPTIVVVVKATLSYAAVGESSRERVLVLAEQEPITLSRPSRMYGAGPEELEVCSDLVPAKGGTDVLLVGHAYRHDGARSSQAEVTWIEADLRLDGWSRRFGAASSGTASRLPLTRGYLRARAGASGEESVGPSRGVMPDPPPIEHPKGFDRRSYNAAPPEQRLLDVPRDVEIELTHLAADAPSVTMKLPALAPRVIVERRSRGPADLPMRCDTIAIDTDAQRITLVWRAGLFVENLDDPGIARIVVSLEDQDAPRSVDEIYRHLPRGAFFYAVEAADLAPGAPPAPTVDDRLRAARYSSWGHREPPDPILDLPEYTAICAELTEERASRGAVLARAGLDEEGFTLEQRAWSARIARARRRGEKGLPDEHRQLLKAARARLAA
ncbi:MAG: DUF2169 domain-containing protein, partial [Byssovorax sp.]